VKNNAVENHFSPKNFFTSQLIFMKLFLKQNMIVFFVLLCGMAAGKTFAQQGSKTNPIPVKSGYAPVNGLKLYYQVYGEGEPIVLLHGAFMTIDLNWGQLIPMLSKTRKVIVMEMQGHGRTADIDRPFSFTALASDVAGAMKHLQLHNADVLGYSFGGTIAFQLAMQYPGLVNKLIIISSTHKHEGELSSVRELMKSFKSDFFDQTPLYTEYKRLAPDTTQWRGFVNKMLDFIKQPYDLGDENIKKIKSPVLIVMGDNDGYDLVKTIETYRLLGGNVSGDIAGLPQSQLAILPGKTHVSVVMDNAALLSIIAPFLGK
jgi:pimeloyl-ACP methyl ester carboxylesterase